MNIPILSFLIFIPLAGVIFLLFINKESEKNAKALAFWISTINFIFALVLLKFYDPANSDFQFIEKYAWIDCLKCSYQIGVDGLSIYFVVLTALITPICIASSFNSIKTRVREYMMAFLLMETFMIGLFCALDIVLFYLFFEGVLIPMFLIIGLWGGPNRIHACFKFFLYTFFASVFMLIGFIKLYCDAGSTNLLGLEILGLPLDTQKWLFWAFTFAFAVKIPMWPFHTWLPDAHTEAPTSGSIVLASILLKMGGYGFLRIVIPILPNASIEYSTIIIVLSLIAIVYASLVALIQTDIKKMIAYSSIAHMGFVTLGIFSFSPQGYTGSVVQMISHGLISAALFLCVGVIYDRYHTRLIENYSGLIKIMPKFSTLFFLILIGAIGVPGTSGFVGEFLVLLAAFKTNKIFAMIATLGVILSAVYMLWLFQRIFMGKLNQKFCDANSGTTSSSLSISDVKNNEIAILTILVSLVLFIGFYPECILKGINKTYTKIYHNNK